MYRWGLGQGGLGVIFVFNYLGVWLRGCVSIVELVSFVICI